RTELRRAGVVRAGCRKNEHRASRREESSASHRYELQEESFIHDEYSPTLPADGETQQCRRPACKPHCGAVHRQFVDPRAAVHNQDQEPALQNVDYADPSDELTRLLRLGAEPVPFDDVDWDSLQSRIEQAVQPKQATRSDVSWWRFTAHWSRVLVP